MGAGEDECGDDELFEGERTMTPLITKAINFFPELAADYKWFDMEECDRTKYYSHLDNIHILNTHKLPFNRCALVGYDLNNGTYAVLVEQETSGKHEGFWCIRAATKFEDARKGLQIDPVFRINLAQIDKETGIKIYFEEPEWNDNQQVLECVSISVTIITSFLENIQTQTTQSHTPIPSKNHAKRIRQGKMPLFSWHTVVIESPKPATPHQGGTHASPRLHDVRGHWVTRSGKRFWRKPHQRGDGSKGIVFHDYRIVGEKVLTIGAG